MDPTEPLSESRRDRMLDKLQAFLEVLVMSGVISGLLAALPFSTDPQGGDHVLASAATVSAFVLMEACIALVLLYLILRSHGESLKDIGLRWNNYRSHIAAGVALVPLLFLVGAGVVLVFRTFLPAWFVDRNPLTDVIRTPRDIVLFLPTALLAGGIKEELQRGFILSRFAHYLGGAGLGLALWSLAFGLGHHVQGAQGMVTATLFGFLLGALFLARRSLVAPIVAHALYDTLAILGIWLTRTEVR